MKIGSCLPIVFSQVIYSGGYSDGEPPLPIPNREAKPVIADGTARPGGRVGSRRAWKESSDERSSGDSFSCLQVCSGAHQLPTPYVHACVPAALPGGKNQVRNASVAPSRKVQLLHLSTQVSLLPVPVAGPRSGNDVFPCGTAVRGRRTGVAVRGFTRRGPPRSGGKGSPDGAYLYAGPWRDLAGWEHRRH